MNTPNKLTIFRMIITPVFLAVFLLASIPHHYLWALVIFAIGSLTDFIDGKLARKNNQVTVFGKLADPIADKMLTTAALLALMSVGLCNVWIIMIVLTREFAITSFRMVASSQGIIIPANIWGKLKTASQMIFTVLILLFTELNDSGIWPESVSLSLVSNAMLWITAALTAISGVIYIVKSVKLIDFSK
ncbi:MAG: CDP-diacylglycerol--glycerol-3-phosphate 3-phosphatidyltransferase [Clostridiales bacterium]|nr:CDP-diacylglycerol--glycerol-3-phosphate 3-phosphatidyltransferase [Clostridiales bacterium]